MSAPFDHCLGYPGLHPTFFKETIQSLGLLACLGFLRTDLFFSLGPKEYGGWHLGLVANCSSRIPLSSGGTGRAIDVQSCQQTGADHNQL